MEIATLLKGYVDEAGKFYRLPGKRQKKKLDAMLLALAAQFTKGQKYTEREVNEILNQHTTFNDPATLRRLLYGSGLFNRTLDGTSYWLADEKTDNAKSLEIAKQFREIYLNGKWVVRTNLQEQLSDLTWQQATTKIGSLNTIAALTFHLNYYLGGVLDAIEKGKLEIRDKYSFDMPPIDSQEAWEKLRQAIFANAEKMATLIEQMPDAKLSEAFIDAKYGDYRRNIQLQIEHGYYHLGQIVIIKKMIIEA